MQINILWTGRAYHSLENCLVTGTPTGAEVYSVVVGGYEGKIYQARYLIRTNRAWETVLVEAHSRHSDQTNHIRLESDGKGNWTSHQRPVEQFKGCIDVDIAITPFTNSLPINRLRLNPKESQQIQVIYFDLLQRQIKPVQQRYTRLSDTKFRYENIPNDFEAVITVDQQGLVVDYPELFVRTAKVKSNYRSPGKMPGRQWV